MKWLLVLPVASVVGIALWFLVRRRPLCKLTLLEEHGEGLDFLVSARRTTIGSEESQDIVVSHPKIARHHAILTCDKKGILLRDCSRRGIRVNGHSVPEAMLVPGDRIELADQVVLLFSGPA
ncbi:MAG: FHA domain-containing protein [Gemmatimonadota bacterium]|jgi:pSer/pThr/pTyr-binding forkhead associated (FHA) protein|nr:hypothetical protein [Gemmatimonadota bacterium]MDP6530197.1 FHA domain-containing protein [Gemmatimonadota bacterium]MDP6801593.1 FHA domain-containing protein [Gemmatimonadota bacterium]MDP7030860.1 FHA domain-containing protein [Gemmatimonadota bacterium]